MTTRGPAPPPLRGFASRKPRWLDFAAWITGAALSCLAAPAIAEVYTPRSDAEIIETLPGSLVARSEEHQLRKRLAADPGNAALAVALARRYLDLARNQGEPRFAGRALALLRRWQPLEQAPAEVVLMAAVLQQHLHDFDGAAGLLERLVLREPRHAQAWLTLATIRRVQGRYDQSDAACNSLLGSGADFHAQACIAENRGLRGRFDEARTSFDRLLAVPGATAASRAWIRTSVAELESRAGRSGKAEAAYRKALAEAPDDYTRLSFADFLLDQQRHREAVALLDKQPRSDAVLLRLAIAGARSPASRGNQPAAADELRARMQQAALRPQTRSTHAREQAMFALFVDDDAARALLLARSNIELQREPVDLLLLARAARAANDAAAVQQARQIRTDMRLRDARLDALL